LMDHSNESMHVEETCSRKTPTLDWNALAKMKHKQRRAVIKKFKRSIRRQRRVANSSSTISDQSQKRIIVMKMKLLLNFIIFHSAVCETSSVVIQSEYDEEEWLRRESVARAEFLKSNEQKKNNILSDASLVETINFGNIDRDVSLSAAEVPNVRIWNNKVSCPYFSRVGSCPHYPQSCTFLHELPEKSSTLLISNIFRHFALVEPCLNESSEEDVWLLYDKFELYQEFCDFFIDIEKQLKEFGKLKKLIVCQNTVRHLRGNVYVEYSKQDEARAAMVGLYGRWYNRMQIYPRLVSVNWTDALCNEFVRFKKCERNNTCYLLHPFQNPTSKRRT
ncbi:U2 small nuclear ribonucleoprotein auxiliary factor 35 kDa subunit-related protein 1, partial [Trichinella pseudospiralis]